MAYVIESGLPDLLNSLGTEIHDLTLTEAADGAQVSRSWAARVLHTAVREVFRRLRRDHVDPLQFKQELSLTVDSSDDELYPLNRRVRQVMRVFDYESADNEHTYWPLAPYALKEQGWVLESDGLRLRGATVAGTLKVWALQTPARQSYGTAQAVTSTSITLAATPTGSLGITSVEPNYYLGARIGIETATGGNAVGAGQVARITAYAASTKICTVAWETAPDATTFTYSILLDLPDCMQRAVVLRAALVILRTNAVMDREMDDVAASYREAYESGRAVLQGAKVGYIPDFRQIVPEDFS